MIIAYGSLCIFLDEKERKTFLDKYKDKPCVLVEERDHSGKATSIIADNYHGMYAVAEHLVRDHGYRRFTYLAGPHGNTDANERRQAVFDVMNAYKVSFDESRVAYGDFSSCVQQQVNQLLDEFPNMEEWKWISGSYMKEFLEEILVENADMSLHGKVQEYLQSIMEVDFRTSGSEENIKRSLQKLFNSDISKCISGHSLIKVFDRFTDECVRRELQKENADKRAIENLLLRKRQIHDKILSHIIKREKEKFSTFQQESWFVPLISRDMLCHMDDEREFYRRSLVKLQALGAEASYFYIFEHPTAHFRNEE